MPLSLAGTYGHSHVTRNEVSSDLPCRDLSVEENKIYFFNNKY